MLHDKDDLLPYHLVLVLYNVHAKIYVHRLTFARAGTAHSREQAFQSKANTHCLAPG